LARPEVLALLNKLRCSGTPLGEYVGERFYRGIVTGLHKAFVIDQNVQDQLLAEDPRSAEVIKPWLRGRDLKRWKVERPGLHLIYVPWEFPIKKYPAVFDHLKQYQSRLARRPEVKEGRFPWYALSRYAAQYVDEFAKPKIIYQKFQVGPKFTFDENGTFVNSAIWMLISDDLNLLAVLNSSLGWFLVQNYCTRIQRGYQLIWDYFQHIPLVLPNSAQRAAIEALVRKLLDAEGQGPQVAEWEQELNALVYELYGLTGEEVAIVEG